MYLLNPLFRAVAEEQRSQLVRRLGPFPSVVGIIRWPRCSPRSTKDPRTDNDTVVVEEEDAVSLLIGRDRGMFNR
jgi:hypothetical protein